MFSESLFGLFRGKRLSLQAMTESFIIQYIIVAVIVVTAVGYAVFRFYRAVKEAKEMSAGCAGCPFAGKCNSTKNADCQEKQTKDSIRTKQPCLRKDKQVKETCNQNTEPTKQR